MNALLGKLLLWVTVEGDPLNDPLPDVIALKKLREQWVKAKDSTSAALVVLKNNQAPELFDRSAPSPGPLPRLGSVIKIKRWMMDLVRF